MISYFKYASYSKGECKTKTLCYAGVYEDDRMILKHIVEQTLELEYNNGNVSKKVYTKLASFLDILVDMDILLYLLDSTGKNFTRITKEEYIKLGGHPITLPNE